MQQALGEIIICNLTENVTLVLMLRMELAFKMYANNGCFNPYFSHFKKLFPYKFSAVLLFASIRQQI